MSARILITGGAGFIGSHLARFFSQEGHAVTVLDLREPEEAVPGVRYLRGNVCRGDDFASLVPAHDAIFHWAAMVSVPQCQEMPLESYETNFLSTVRILEQVRKANEARKTGDRIRVLFSGSSSVYGNLGDSVARIPETSPLAEPISFYGAQKLASEQAIRVYAKTFSIPSVVFRFFNVYGPGQKATSPYSGVISVFTKAVRESQPLALNSGGLQTRDFVSVHDIVAACARALESSDAGLLSGLPVNLGSGRAISIRELAGLIMEVSGNTTPTVDRPARAGDILHSCADISRASALLGWKPAVELRAGLEELLKAR